MQMWRNKRALSESDCEDLYHDDQSKDCSSSGEGLLSESTHSGGGGNMTRKRRRGIIEKRRRDRINHSLSELRRLVPSAFEKQGSAKLEKAEILQLTVDHLKMLHAKGLDALAYDPHKYAMDYHNIGFRECAAEVARYMVSVEGMDVQDPLRLRLMSHLQCLSAQRELNNGSSSNKPAGSNNGNIVPGSPGVNGPPPTSSSSSAPATPSSGSGQTTSWPFPPPAMAAAPTAYNNYANMAPASGPVVQHGSQSTGQPAMYGDYGMMDNSYARPAPIHGHSMPHHHHPHHGHTMTTLQPVQPGHHPHHPGAAPYLHPFPSHAGQNTSYATSAGNQVKPYRPWGAELAY